jgi:hypothetical protein
MWRIFLVLFSHWPSLQHFFFSPMSVSNHSLLCRLKISNLMKILSNRANVCSSLIGHTLDVKTFFDMTTFLRHDDIAVFILTLGQKRQQSFVANNFYAVNISDIWIH